MSLRFRLTLLYSAILALTLVAFSAALYVTLDRTTLRVLDDRLADDAARLIAAKELRFDFVILPVRQFEARTTFIQLRDAAGAVRTRTDNLGDVVLPLSEAGLEAARRGEPWKETAAAEQVRLRISTKPVKVNGRIIGLVQVAQPLADLDQSLRSLRRILIIGSSVATVIACGVGWLLAGMALRPIKRITRTARAIGAERDFGRRVTYTGPADEVGQLATTFNTMLTELQGAYRQVEQALLAQRRFVADASHELRTPLTTIRGNIALLQRDPPMSPDDTAAALGDMVDETERLMRLVNDLLVLARADAGRTLPREPVAVKPLVEEVCRRAALLAPGRTVECDDVAAVTVLGNRDALQQVLLILLDNALKFTPDTARIDVSVRGGDDRAAIAVRDTGPGIAPDALPHIFERFYRSEASRTSDGAGLGLAIARTLVEVQGGTLAVESRIGEGSVFTLDLPLALQPEPSIPSTANVAA